MENKFMVVAKVEDPTGKSDEKLRGDVYEKN